MPKQYKSKAVTLIEAMCFTTNNEPGPAAPCMDAIVLWINQGRGITSEHAWHNGTNIFVRVTYSEMKPASVGDYIVKIKGPDDEASSLFILTAEEFNKTYEAI